MIRQAIGCALLTAIVAALVGCDEGAPAMGEVSGTVTVDGQTPMEGSSITFFPTDGKSQTAGDLIEQGRYSAQVPLGVSKVEIRVPRPAAGAAATPAGPGGGPGAGAGMIEESLPPKFNDQTELTFDVKPGKNEKNWDLTTK